MTVWTPDDELIEDEHEGAGENGKRKHKPHTNGHDAKAVLDLLSGIAWLSREIPPPDFLLGEMISTTCRVELVGPTGLGKTNILLAEAFAVADGDDFLHWKGSSKPRRWSGTGRRHAPEYPHG